MAKDPIRPIYLNDDQRNPVVVPWNRRFNPMPFRISHHLSPFVMMILMNWAIRTSAFHVSNKLFPTTFYTQFLLRHFSRDNTLFFHNRAEQESDGFFASDSSFPTFQSIGIQSPILLQRINDFFQSSSAQSSSHTSPRPSAVQAASFKTIQDGDDVTIGAETGSGKTLAYLLPIIDDILQNKSRQTLEHEPSDSIHQRQDYTYARAMILVPNKELANQVLRMAIPFCGGPSSVIWNGASGTSKELNDEYQKDIAPNPSHIVRLGLVPGNLNTPEDYKPFRMVLQDPVNHPPLDILISTPASLDRWGLNPKFIDFFADIQTLVIDEADMLFDGGYIRSLENVLLGFKRADRLDASYGVTKTQYILVAATVPDMGLKSVHAYIQKKFPRAVRVTMKGMHNARHYGLQYKTLWIEDDYSIMEEQVKRKRMEKLIMLLKQPSYTKNGHKEQVPLATQGTAELAQGLKDEKVIIFLNSVEDVDAVTKALMRADIPVVPYHAKIPLIERVKNLDRFRLYKRNASPEDRKDPDSTVPIMCCTDLAARGLDITGVTAVVQLQFAGNVVAHLHRMGRCGRAGNRDGRGIIFFGSQERELVSVIQEAERQQDRMVLQGDVMEPILSEGEADEKAGKVDDAFSRKRGFTKKRKKIEKKE